MAGCDRRKKINKFILCLPFFCLHFIFSSLQFNFRYHCLNQSFLPLSFISFSRATNEYFFPLLISFLADFFSICCVYRDNIVTFCIILAKLEDKVSINLLLRHQNDLSYIGIDVCYFFEGFFVH